MTFEEMKAVARQIATNLGLSAEMRAAGAEELVAEAWRAGLEAGREEKRNEVVRLTMRVSDLKHALGTDAIGWFDRAKAAEIARDAQDVQIRELNAEIARLSDANTKLKERGFVP